MKITIDIIDEQSESGFLISVYGIVSITKKEEKPSETFSFFMMESLSYPYTWDLFIYLGKKSKGITIDLFPEFQAKHYQNRESIKWIAINAEEILKECKFREKTKVILYP